LLAACAGLQRAGATAVGSDPPLQLQRYYRVKGSVGQLKTYSLIGCGKSEQW
jgi:hypothetical protein